LIQFRRLAALLIGAWLAGSLLMDVAAIANFSSIDRFLSDPGIQSAELIHGAGHDTVRTLMRRGAAEASGWLFEQWEWVQIITGLALLLVFIFGSRPPKIPMALCIFMLGIVLVERFALTPSIVRLGRIVDFLSPGESSPDRKLFEMYHSAYTALDLVKLVSGFAISAILIIRTRPDPQMFAREAELALEVAPTRRPAR